MTEAAQPGAAQPGAAQPGAAQPDTPPEGAALPRHIHRLGAAGPVETGRVPPDKRLSGDGATATWNAFSDPSGRFHAGHWRHGPGAIAVSYAEDELCVILSGTVRLTGADGVAADFGPGDAFVIAAGFAGTWDSLTEVTKIYAILLPPTLPGPH
jgi:uncharacterized cupin superfamily protein